jgi:hypothetical protein
MDERAHRDTGSPLDPEVDERGKLTMHCTQCGSSLDPSSEFCTVCSAEVSGGTEAGAAAAGGREASDGGRASGSQTSGGEASGGQTGGTGSNSAADETSRL